MLNRAIQIFVIPLLFLSAAASAQTRPDSAGFTVVLRDTPGGGAEGNYDLLTIKDGAVVHTEKIGNISCYCKSPDRLVTIAGAKAESTLVRVFELPQGNPLNSFTIPNLFAGVLQMGAAEMGIIDKDTAYFTAYERLSGVLVKVDLKSGDSTVLSIPPGRVGSSRLHLAGNTILAGSQFALQGFSIPDGKFTKSIPKTTRDAPVYVPHDGLYSSNIKGEFTRIADESLTPIPKANQKTRTLIRGVYDVQSLGTAATEKTLVILCGPRLNGELRGEAIRPALWLARPSDGTMVGSINLSFTPTENLFRTAQENVVALVNAKDNSIVKYDCATCQEVGRVVLPPMEGRERPDGIQVVY